MSSSLGQECMDTPGQNGVKQKMQSVWKRFVFFWGSSLEQMWSQFVDLLVAEGWPMTWVLLGRRQPGSAHPLAAFRWFKSRGFRCFNHMAHNSDLSQQRIQSSLESSWTSSYRGTEAGKSRTSSAKSLDFLFNVWHKAPYWNPKPFWSFILSRDQLQTAMNVTLV